MTLLEPRINYKPFQYPWAFEAWITQQRLHWMPEEVPMSDDVQDWRSKLTEPEQNLLTQIFRFFVQADTEVHNCYMHEYSRVFKLPEICMMLSSFANIETIHMHAYAYLIDTISMPETEYLLFMKYKEMKDKYDYMQQFNCNDKKNIAMTLAVFGAFTEGLQLFASFAMLLNFQRFNKMKGMGQIVAWSARDETLHTMSIIKLFRTFIGENPELWTFELQSDIQEACKVIVSHEDAFIDLAFSKGEVEGLTSDDVKKYIRYIANMRMSQLGLGSVYEDTKNPLPWLDHILNGTEFANFFESRVTEYSKSSTSGSWEEVF